MNCGAVHVAVGWWRGPDPLDCALWGLQNNRADDGDYLGTVRVVPAVGATTGHNLPTGAPDIDALLTGESTTDCSPTTTNAVLG